MKQPHEIKADYKKADDVIALGERIIKGKYDYIDQAGNLREITYPVVIKNEIEAISEAISEVNGVLKDNYSRARTEKSKKKNKFKQEKLNEIKKGLKDKLN